MGCPLDHIRALGVKREEGRGRMSREGGGMRRREEE